MNGTNAKQMMRLSHLLAAEPKMGYNAVDPMKQTQNIA